MRIGIDARLWNETGVGRYIRNLVKHLQILDRENEYLLFVGNKDYDEIKLKVQSASWRIKFKVVKADIRWHTLAEQWEMPKILGREKLDLVHFPYFNVPIFYRGPFVVTIHDLIINHFPTGRATTLPWPFYQAKRLGYKIILGQALKKARKIIAVSEATKKEIRDHFGVESGKIVVTYESGELDVNPKTIEQPASPAGGLSNRTIPPHPYLLYVGNAHPHKNLESLLEALKTMKQSNNETMKNLRLVLVGREDYFYQRLKNRVEEMGLGGEIIFYGGANDAELTHLYKNARALILPSLMEGFGLPALEAMSLGCLVLASDIPAFREICADAALYFNPLNIEDIARRIKEVCSNVSEHQNKLSRGLVRAKRFSWGKMVKETLKVYQEISRFPRA